MNHPTNLPQTSTESHAVPRSIAFDGLDNFNLNRRIGEENQTISAALVARRSAEKTAVKAAWRLGVLLAEKKRRLPHGAFGPWLESVGIATSSASEYMQLAAQISGAGNLGASIRVTIRSLGPPPKPKPVTAVQPVPDEPEPAGADPAEVIAALEDDLGSAQERVALMEESVDPKSRKVFDKINNQSELIRTLKASVANWQGKHADAVREIRSLKRTVKALELANSRQSV